MNLRGQRATPRPIDPSPRAPSCFVPVRCSNALVKNVKCIALALAALLTGCASSDVDYDQLPDLVRIESDPPGVDLQLSGFVTRYVTPCDVKREALRGRTLTFTRVGYIPFQGQLGDLEDAGRGSYLLTLRKL